MLYVLEVAQCVVCPGGCPVCSLETGGCWEVTHWVQSAPDSEAGSFSLHVSKTSHNRNSPSGRGTSLYLLATYCSAAFYLCRPGLSLPMTRIKVFSTQEFRMMKHFYVK